MYNHNFNGWKTRLIIKTLTVDRRTRCTLIHLRIIRFRLYDHSDQDSCIMEILMVHLPVVLFITIY
jgi:hypothetical protein